MSKQYRKGKLSFSCPKCGAGFYTRNRCPRCISCKTALRVIQTNPHLQVVIRRRKGKRRMK